MRIHVSLAALVVTLATGGAAFAGAILQTPMVSSGSGGSWQCNATNVGQGTLDIQVLALEKSGGVFTNCPNVASVRKAINNHTCSHQIPGATTRLCQVIVTGGSKTSVRAILTIQDSTGATIFAVDAK